jgi:hypothetical protein
MKDYLSVRVGIKAVAAAFELLAKLRKVIDFSVEDDPQAAVFVVNRLPPAGKVDDAQTPHTQPYGTFRVNALVIRTTVNNRLAHPADVSGINNIAMPADHPGYSAH